MRRAESEKALRLPSNAGHCALQLVSSPLQILLRKLRRKNSPEKLRKPQSGFLIFNRRVNTWRFSKNCKTGKF